MDINRNSLILNRSIDAAGNPELFAIAMNINRKSMNINTKSMNINWNSRNFNISIEASGNPKLFWRRNEHQWEINENQHNIGETL